MPSSRDTLVNRRRLLRFIAASPLFAGSSGFTLAQEFLPRPRHSDPVTWWPQDAGHMIKDPKEAINVFDFEPVMRRNVPPAHFGFMASGVGDEVTLRANREGFAKFQMRPRRLVDVSKVDMGTEILGERYPTPIILCPVSSQARSRPHAAREPAITCR